MHFLRNKLNIYHEISNTMKHFRLWLHLYDNIQFVRTHTHTHNTHTHILYIIQGRTGTKIQPWHCSHTGPHCPTHGNMHSLPTFVYRWWNNISSTVTDISTFNVSGKQCWASYSTNVIYYSLLVTPFKSNIVTLLITFWQQ